MNFMKTLDNVNTTCLEISKIDFNGYYTSIPCNWYKHIRVETHTDFVALAILADIVYLHGLTKKNSKKHRGYKQHFDGEQLIINTQVYANKFNTTAATIANALHILVENELITIKQESLTHKIGNDNLKIESINYVEQQTKKIDDITLYYKGSENKKPSTNKKYMKILNSEIYVKPLYSDISDISYHSKLSTRYYIENFLKSKNKDITSVNRRTIPYLWRVINQNVNFNKVADYIINMNYYSFLHSIYWKIISEYVRQEKGYICEICGKKRKYMQVHHRTYKHHGYEHLYWNTDLLCLCEKCHKTIHEGAKTVTMDTAKDEITKQEYEKYQKNSGTN